MVLIPAGSFLMGSGDGEQDESPPHAVAVDAFWMDRTEVTQEQYGRLVLGNPSHFKGPDRPVEQVSWADAALYCNERSRSEGLQPCYDEETARCDFQANGYRLPTEAEWEYACRAGAASPYSFGAAPQQLGQHAWFADNAGKKTQPVARKKPNAWGLYDVHGNVAEWCNDVYDAEYYRHSPKDNPPGPADGEKYVLRGGAWNSRPPGCRAPARVGADPGFQDACFARDAIGFRCVRRADLAGNTSPKLPVGAGLPTWFGAGLPTSPKPPTAGLLGDSGRPTVELVLRSGDRSTTWSGDRSTTVAFVVPALAGIDRRKAALPTGLLYSEVCLRHRTGEHHPERPERLEAIWKRLKQDGLLDRLTRLQPRADAECWLTSVHSPEYVERVKRRCQEAPGYLDSGDTPVSRESYEAALTAVGGVLSAVDAVAAGKVRNAFCAVRPPGHHASRERGMGFCLFNNVAIAARYAQQKQRLARILIVDWDVHHGNGTQATFDDDPHVMYFSVHQHPFYPGTDLAEDAGQGKARGTKINVPLPAGSGDAEFLRAFDERLRPAALEFRPDLVLISAGFDAHEDDLLGGMKVTTDGYAQMTRRVRRIAEDCCQGRLISLLEGGYHLEALGASAAAHVRTLMEPAGTGR
ncbi:MAG TPA: SUMF1/EgtB/PvdO family nonheme iron enzyme [Candidatus Anammoximicrobium sp.]|nr:SUMF1/EgtB/PvdO family nonheme iron enzyme [Candidatus Anammoximicrobium sp.]